MKLKSIFLLIFSLLFITLFSKDIDFFREDLIFNLKDSFFYVKGDYYFRNNSNKKIKNTLFYPFPQDSLYGSVDHFLAISMKDSTDCFIKSNEKGLFFSIEIPAKQEQIYLIGYRQKLLGKKAEYILTTTQSWEKPFEIVNYTLIFPTYVKMDSLSYLPDSLNTKNGSYYLFYHKENFMPNKNMIIQFK